MLFTVEFDTVTKEAKFVLDGKEQPNVQECYIGSYRDDEGNMKYGIAMHSSMDDEENKCMKRESTYACDMHDMEEKNIENFTDFIKGLFK